MLDVRQLFIRPANRPGYLKGTFTLYCAYMRGDEARPPAGRSEAAAAATAAAALPAEAAVGLSVSEGAEDVAQPAEPVPEPMAQAPQPEAGGGRPAGAAAVDAPVPAEGNVP